MSRTAVRMAKGVRKRGRGSAAPGGVWHGLVVALVVGLLSFAALAFFRSRGETLHYGDALAHLTIARRIVDSRTPGPDQIGTVWLPLPHALALPLVSSDSFWRSGLAGALPAAACFVLAATFLFFAARRALQSTAAGVATALLFATNPNLLYLQATPMTEPVLFAGLLGVLAATLWFAQARSWWSLLAVVVASWVAALTRYEGWFVLPFVAAFLLAAGGERRWRAALVYSALVAVVPLAWLAHNHWQYGNPLEFYNGPYSAKAIYQRALDQGMARYAGDHDAPKALLYYRTAARLCAGPVLAAVGLAGVLAALWRRAWWPLLFLALSPVFYVLSLYSSGTPIFMPELWPNSHYNTRYGLGALPLLAFGAAALVSLVPLRLQSWAASAVLFAAAVPWLAYPRPDNWIVWKEARVNSVARRAWTTEAARFLRAHYRPGDGIWSPLGDLSGIYREAGIPLREVLQEGNNPWWMATLARPELYLHEAWAVAQSGDSVSMALRKAGRNGLDYRLVRTVEVKGAPLIEIYRRATPLDAIRKPVVVDEAEPLEEAAIPSAAVRHNRSR